MAEDAVMSEPFSAWDSLVTGQKTRNLVNKVDSSLANNGHKSIIHAYLQPWTCSKSLSKAGNFRDPIRDRKPNYREKICSSSESNDVDLVLRRLQQLSISTQGAGVRAEVEDVADEY
jgi:hypothetical protein